MRLFRKRAARNWATAVALGVAVAFLSWWWQYAWLPPGAWEDVAVASGLHPPKAPFPLLWHALVHPLFTFLDMARAIHVLRLAGHAAIGLVAMLLFALFRETAPKVMRATMRGTAWCRRIVWVVLAQGVVLFVCSDPVWEAGQAFCPATLHLLLLLAAALVLVRYALRRGVIAGWYWTMLFLGALAGDTPLGLLLAVGCLVVCRVRAEAKANKMTNPMADPFIRTVTMRRMTLAAALGWLAVVCGNVWLFASLDGLAAHGLSGFQYSITYLATYWRVLVAASTPAGWLLFALVVLVPLVLSMAHVKAATDNENFLPYWHAGFFLLVGLVAFLQLAGWRSFWFWTWAAGEEAVKSLLMRCVASLVNAQTFTFALTVLGVEVYFRNYRRIAGIKFQDSVEETARGADLVVSLRRFSRAARVALLFEPLAALALVVPYRVQATARGIVGVLRDFARQTVLECGDARYLFTDGTMDTALELCAREHGSGLLPLSLAGGASERERYLRRRGAEDEEDRDMLSYSAMDTLRTWLRLKESRMAAVAVQLGFELWAVGRRPLPPAAGLVARPSGFPKGGAEAGSAAAHALAERILGLYGDDEELEGASPALRALLTRTQWRVARMCRMRADRLDREGRSEAALKESRLADALDARNVSFTRVRRQLEVVGQGSSRLTPREGLRLGMERADFRMAEMFARQVLFSDPDDLAANFVMGMYYFGNEQYGRAEIYLAKCLELQPGNASVLNNLAVAQLRQGLLEEAEANARKAVAADGKSAEARRTLENVLKDKAAAEKKGAEKLLRLQPNHPLRRRPSGK